MKLNKTQIIKDIIKYAPKMKTIEKELNEESIEELHYLRFRIISEGKRDETYENTN